MITLALATIRATRLAVADTITAPARTRLFKQWPASPDYKQWPGHPGPPWQSVPTETGEPSGVWHRPPTKFGVWAAKMLNCPRWCASIWAAVIMLFCARVRPLRWVPRALALSEVVAYLWYASEEGEPTSLRRAQQRAHEAEEQARQANP